MTAGWLEENALFGTTRGRTLIQGKDVSTHLAFSAATTGQTSQNGAKLFEVPCYPPKV